MFRVLTWNILADEFVHEQDYLHFDISLIKNRNQRIERITHFLLQQNVDIILLQEVMLDEQQYLYNQLSEQFYFSSLFSNQWKHYPHSESGNLVLFRKKYFSESFDTKPLLYKKSCFGIHVFLYEKETNRPLHIFNIHLNDEYYMIRKAQLKSIQLELQKHDRVILGGDFNQNYWSNSTLYELDDNYSILNKTNFTYYVDKANTNIDNILVKGWIVDKIKIHDNDNDNNNDNDKNNNDFFMKLYGSDHLPIYGNII